MAYALACALALALGMLGPGFSVGFGTSDSGSAGVASGVSGAAARARLRALPLQAQSAISAALGPGEAPFAARRWRDGWRLEGGAVSARVGRDGDVTVRAAGGWVSLRVLGVGRGGRLQQPDGARSMRAHVNRVAYVHGGLREWLAAGPLGVEQGFAVGQRPTHGRGALTLALGLGGSLQPRLAGPQLLLAAAAGTAMSYGGLVALDARGRRLPASLALRGRVLLLRVIDRGAVYPVRIDPLFAASVKLVGNCPGNCAGPSGTGEGGYGWFGFSVAVSTDGSTAVIGAPHNDGGVGAAWVFTQVDGVWTEQAELVGNCKVECGGPNGTGEIGDGEFGWSVAMSADGGTALIGAPHDETTEQVRTGGAVTILQVGSAWVFSQAGGGWAQVGARLLGDCTASCSGPNGTGETTNGEFGYSVSLSGDGSTALIGAPQNDSGQGGAWVFTQAGGAWSQQGGELIGSCASVGCSGANGTGEVGHGGFGWSVAMSADGSTALIGAPDDNTEAGAAWVFTQSGGTWTQQNELFGDCAANCSGPSGTGETGAGQFGYSVALSTDGSTALIGTPDNNGYQGAAWLFTQSGGTWTQQDKLLGDCSGTCSGANGTGENGAGFFGYSVALSADGSAALIGAANDGNEEGAAWLFVQSGAGWTQQNELLGDCSSGCSATDSSGELAAGQFGESVSMSGTANVVAIGAPSDGLIPGTPAVPAAPATTTTPAAPAIPATPATPVPTGAAWMIGATPAAETPPVVSGTSALGQTLSCSTGSWAGAPAGYNYQWNSDSSAVQAATDPTYVVQPSDQGNSITCSVTAFNASGASAPATSNSVYVSQATPVNTSQPSIIGLAQVGGQLACLAGSWTNTPYDFNYQWARDGVPIQNATQDTYTPVTLDEGSALTCTVVAIGTSDDGLPATSEPLSVPVPYVAGCPAATGSLSGTTLGRVHLGMSRAQALKAYAHSRDSRRLREDLFCLTPLGVKVGYASSALLGALTSADRKRFAGKVIWASTENPRYAINGIRAGSTIATPVQALHAVQSQQIGANTWYLVTGRSSTDLLRATGGVVQEIGIADTQFTRTPAEREMLLSQIA